MKNGLKMLLFLGMFFTFPTIRAMEIEPGKTKLDISPYERSKIVIKKLVEKALNTNHLESIPELYGDQISRFMLSRIVSKSCNLSILINDIIERKRYNVGGGLPDISKEVIMQLITKYYHHVTNEIKGWYEILNSIQ